MSPAPDLAKLRLDLTRAQLAHNIAVCRAVLAVTSEEESERVCAADLRDEAQRLEVKVALAEGRLAAAEGRVL